MRLAVLEGLKRSGPVPLGRMRQWKGIEPPALNTALLRLKREGIIATEARTIHGVARGR